MTNTAICPHCGKAHGFDFSSFVASCSAVTAIEFSTQKVVFGTTPKAPQPPKQKARIVRKVSTERTVHKVS